MVELRKRNLVYGWGINDADYNVVTWVEGKQKMCAFYAAWKDMLQRCNSTNFKEKKQNAKYAECFTNESWKYFSDFKTWAINQGFEDGLRLDKDILISGNKEYGPDTCAFVPPSINNLLLLSKQRDDIPLGATYSKVRQRMVNELKKPYFSRLSRYGTHQLWLGFFGTAFEAHKCWQLAKADYIEGMVAWYATQDCFRTDVADALTSRVWKLRLDNAQDRETKYL